LEQFDQTLGQSHSSGKRQLVRDRRHGKQELRHLWQGTFRFTDRLSATGGLRSSKDRPPSLKNASQAGKCLGKTDAG